jgi:hypothetical protein
MTKRALKYKNMMRYKGLVFWFWEMAEVGIYDSKVFWFLLPLFHSFIFFVIHLHTEPHYVCSD